MDGMENGLGIVYTPHQCWYSDRKSPLGEKLKSAPMCFRDIINHAKLDIPIFNPLHHTWEKIREKRVKVTFWPVSKYSVTMVVFVGGMGDHLIACNKA